MISRDCIITVNGNTATIDSDIYLYKYDKNIQLVFSIINSKYMYDNDDSNNLIKNMQAAYAQVKFKKDDSADIEIEFDIQATREGAVLLTINEELTDEDTELGEYTIQIRLLDSNKNSVVTLPPVESCIHIQAPLFEKLGANTNEVNKAVVNKAVARYAAPLSATVSDGTFNSKAWVDGDKITTAELNRMETGIKTNSTQLKDIANKSLTIEQKKALNNMFKVCAYISDDISSQYDAFKTAFGIETTSYTIANNLTNCTNNNSNANVEEGENYKATLIADTGYVLSSVTITMGGTDITSTAYSNGIITINNVTGNIVITATAVVKTLTSISATYTGGNVNVGTELTSLTGITVTATYSDNTTSIVNGYTLSGTIAEGSNTITVTYQDKTTTFTVTGVAVSTDVSNETKWTNGVAYELNLIENKYVDDKNGELKDYNGYSCTPYLYCKGASKIRTKIIYSVTMLASNNNYNAFYDENKTFISSFSMLNGGLSEENYALGVYKDVEVPSNAVYFVLSHKSAVLHYGTSAHEGACIDVTPYA